MSLIESIYTTGTVENDDGEQFELRDAISQSELNFLSNIISADENVHKVLEIGCAHGLSSLSICEALRDRENHEHVIIDPMQYSLYNGVGVHNLGLAKSNFFTLVEKPSEIALPALANERPASFDLTFIDGYHTFEHTMLDLFYANMLTKVGGYIVIDDCKFVTVAKAVSYYSNYPAYEVFSQHQEEGLKYKTAFLIGQILPRSIASYVLPHMIYELIYTRCMFGTMVALKKVAEDDRPWDWFAVS